MNKQIRDFDESTCQLLSGKIQGRNYVREVQAVLAAEGNQYSDGYITRVVGGFSYNNDIWKAVKRVIVDRSKAREINRAEIESLVE